LGGVVAGQETVQAGGQFERVSAVVGECGRRCCGVDQNRPTLNQTRHRTGGVESLRLVIVAARSHAAIGFRLEKTPPGAVYAPLPTRETKIMKHDIVFIGHMCVDRIFPYGKGEHVAPGSAVLCGAMAAARVGGRTAVITRMHPADDAYLQPLRDAGVDCCLIPAPVTTEMVVTHPTPDVDVREMRQTKNAGFMQADELPPIDARFVHLAGITDREFDLPFMRELKRRGHSVSVDLQSFVRQVNEQTRVISFADVPAKREIVALMDRVKLDVVEAELLTGTRDLAKAAAIVASWGCKEVVITRADGVQARVDGKDYYEAFTNRSIVGRTGRGDTTFAGYMVRRLEHGPAEALKFAAALVSIKMETPGPFQGTLADVLVRMNAH
jgi:sugar/nucleoside kinase (ribokinase family)